MLFIKFVDESLDQRQRLAGAEQQVALDLTLQVDPISSPLLKINVFDIEGLAPPGVKEILFANWISFDREFVWVEAAALGVQVGQSGVVVGVDVGHMHLSKTRLGQSDKKNKNK